MDTNGEMVTLRHKFLVGEVTSCLLSLGQLLKSGWTLNHDENQKNKLLLCSPDRETAIPVASRGMSPAIEGTVRKIKKGNMEAEEDDEHQIRMMVQEKDMASRQSQTIYGGIVMKRWFSSRLCQTSFMTPRRLGVNDSHSEVLSSENSMNFPDQFGDGRWLNSVKTFPRRRTCPRTSRNVAAASG